NMSLLDRWDFHRGLSVQFPASAVRLLYSASGTLPAASVLRDMSSVVEHSVYWAALDETEAQYLMAIFNSEAARSLVASMQARGQWGARHFDKLMFELPIPKFNPTDPTHRELAADGMHAEEIAATVALPGANFVRS